MNPPDTTWYDSFFIPIHRLGHRLWVEFALILLIAVFIHWAYSALAARQEKQESVAKRPESSISIGTITNSGAGSSTTINQSSQPNTEDDKKR